MGVRLCMTMIPKSEVHAKLFADTGEKRGELFSKIFADFVLQFPGKVAARNFTKNLPTFHEKKKQNSFTVRFWEWEGPRLWGFLWQLPLLTGASHLSALCGSALQDCFAAGRSCIACTALTSSLTHLLSDRTCTMG